MQAELNVITNKFRVKDGNKWQEVSLIRVNQDSPDDQPPKLTKAEKEAEARQQDFYNKRATLIAAIEDVKQKAELVQLGIETQENLEAKVQEYKTAKSAYDDAKEIFNSGAKA